MSHSLIVPRHLAEQRRSALRDPGVEVNPRVQVNATYDDAFFDAEKVRIRERIGPVLGQVRVLLNHVLVYIYVRPDRTAGGIINPNVVTEEDVYQGRVGLVLKCGPRCFEDSDKLTWTDADKFTEDDWVTFRRGDGNGTRVSINGVECISFENERAIKMVVPRPDLFY